jgi:uncharacterized protein YbaP (TraB family)
LKNILILLVSILSFCSFSQKQNSLLWEISGNGLTKKSYVYGTMHVSDKISYHLSDAFFKHLLEADIVSNESDPQTWDVMLPILRPNLPALPSNFYQRFYQKPIDKNQLKSLFQSNNYFNSLLSGINGSSADYQEDTVLDLFIFQTGKKYNKRIVGLEDTMESILTVLKMKPEDAQPDEKRTELLIKMVKGKNFKEALNDYYRAKDVVMLDSLYKLLFNKRGHQLMITKRNEVMANSIDSLSHTGSLFAAIGAAHLSGKEGVLQLLKNKGFVVNPVFDSMTKNGEKQKQTIETFFPKPNFKNTATKDGMVQLPLNNALVSLKEEIGSPDYTNGGVITVKRLPLHNYLNSKNENFDTKRLDSLLYENIPGNIISKNYFDTPSGRGYEITNSTKTGNFQHRKFYITPLEIIAITMTGNLNYTQLYEDAVFKEIQIKTPNNEWTSFTPEKGGFALVIPSYYFATGNTSEVLENINLEAFDAKENAYYFLQQQSLSTTNELEDSEFEQKQIHYEYYLQNNLQAQNTQYNLAQNSYTTTSQIGEQKMKLKSVIYGSHYYLLGAINASDASQNKFFDSFNWKIPFVEEVYKTYKDTVNNYSVSIPENTNKGLFLNLKPNEFQTKNQFSGKSNTRSIISASGQTVEFSNYKFPKYDAFSNEQEIKEYLKKLYIKESNYDDNTTYFSEEGDLFSKSGLQTSKWNALTEDKEDKYELLEDSFLYNQKSKVAVYNAFIYKANAVQGIKVKAIVYPSEYHILSAIVPKNYQDNIQFIETVFNTFKASDPAINDSKSRLDLFIEDANSVSDTIRYSAVNSIYYLNLEENDFDKATNFIEGFKFKTSEIVALNQLITKIGLLNESRILPFLMRWYKKETILTSSQITILETLAKRADKQSYKTILKLLEYDLPLSSDASELNDFFNLLKKDAENSKILFPKLFQYYNIPEYNKQILKFTNQLLDKNLVAANKLSSFKKTLITNAKLEYKRVLSWKQNNIEVPIFTTDSSATVATDYSFERTEEPIATSDYIADINDAPAQNLINYLVFLQSFSNDQKVKNLIDKIEKLDITSVKAEILRLQFADNKLSKEEINEALESTDLQFVMMQLLANKSEDDFRTKFLDEDIAKAAIIYLEKNADISTIEFLEKRTSMFNDTPVVIYFFACSEKPNSYDSPENYVTAISFVLDGETTNLMAYKLLDSEVLKEVESSNQIDAMVFKFINEKHARASFEKLENQNDFFMYDDY